VSQLLQLWALGLPAVTTAQITGCQPHIHTNPAEARLQDPGTARTLETLIMFDLRLMMMLLLPCMLQLQ
jgi:hypothetical protein